MSRLFELHASEICLSLDSEDKKKRLKALEKLDNVVTNNESNWNKCELSVIWKIINQYITKNVSDKSELCRNLSIDITKKFLEVLPVDEKNIIYLVPVLKRRLGSQEIHEESEEVRLNCVILIKLIIRIYKKYLSIYHNDFITILSRTVIDSYPKIKKESCESISQLAENIPLKFYYKSNYVIKAILTNFTHQHYRVRVASVNAIGQVMLYGNSKDMNEVSTPMAERLFDQSGAVRLAVIQVAGMWLIKLQDRYSWWNKLIPLILTGLNDEISDLREKAEQLWSAAGHHYLEENYNDDKIKNKMDFLTIDPKHYPPSIKRPNLGCRVIVQRNISHLIGGIAKDLNDWLPDIRVKSAQLLAVLVLNAEEDITQHIHKLLPAMYRACNDEDKRVIVNVVIAAEYIGHFVLPETYCKLVLPTLVNEGHISSGHLSVFSAMIRGSKKEKLTNKLKDIGRFLQQHNICRSKKAVYQQELLKSCDAILSVCQENSSVIAEQLFEIIFTVWSMAQQQKIENYSKKLLNDLTLMTNNKNMEGLFENHIPSILNMLKNSLTTLTVFSPEFYIFNNCLKNTRIATSKNIDLFMPILKITMDKDSLDFELRLKMLILLSEYFQQRNKSLNNIEKLKSFFADFLDNILIPNLIWKAGRLAESVRTSAMSCLCALLDNEDDTNNHPIFSNADKFVEYFKKLKPIIMSLTSDNSKKTRIFSLKGIYILLKYAMKLKCVSDEDVIEIYPGIIKRLDDGSDDVRLVAIEVLVFVSQALSCNYDFDLGRSHIDYLYTSTIIHLDDPEEKFQSIMLDAVIQLAKIHPKMLYDKIEKCKINFRNQQALEKVQKECQRMCFEKVTLNFNIETL